MLNVSFAVSVYLCHLVWLTEKLTGKQESASFDRGLRHCGVKPKQRRSTPTFCTALASQMVGRHELQLEEEAYYFENYSPGFVQAIQCMY